MDPKSIVNTLKDDYNFKLKGTGPVMFHLGMDFYRDEDGVLCIAPRKHIDKMIGTYERMFGSKPQQKFSSPLDKGDHPELDQSELLDDEDVERYQSLIGAMQWAISIGRIVIATAVMMLSSFRAAPHKGHMDRVKRVNGYLSKMHYSAIRVHTEEPDYSALPEQEFDWTYSI